MQQDRMERGGERAVLQPPWFADAEEFSLGRDQEGRPALLWQGAVLGYLARGRSLSSVGDCLPRCVTIAHASTPAGWSRASGLIECA